MEFTLTYRGPLPANGNPKDKHFLRRHFHKQLKELWKQPPLKDKTTSENHPLQDSFEKQIGGLRFVPLVTERFSFTATLEILFLRPGYPGQLLNIGGDIDNRMKTLFDAFAIPNANQLAQIDPPAIDEIPLFCLLEDDALITGLSVRTDRLLDCNNEKEAVLMVHVETRSHFAHMVTDL